MTITANETPRERQIREELERRRRRERLGDARAQQIARAAAHKPIHDDERAESVRQYIASLVSQDPAVQASLWAGVALILSQKAACDPARGWKRQAVTLPRVAEDSGQDKDEIAAAFDVLEDAGLVRYADRTWQWKHDIDLTAYGV